MDNYRPVSLLTSFSKVLEKVAYLQLTNYLKINKLFYNSQNGFREDHLSESATLELIDGIIKEKTIKRTPFVYIYIYRFIKGIPQIDHDILMNRLNYYEINGIELKWFRRYLTNRSQLCRNWQRTIFTVYNYKSSTWFNTWPIVFPYIYIYDIPECNSLFSFLSYVDDTSPVSHI